MNLSVEKLDEFPILESTFSLMTNVEKNSIYNFAKKLPNNSTIVEVGTALGGTACSIASINSTFNVHCIDSFDSDCVHNLWKNFKRCMDSYSIDTSKKLIDDIDSLFLEDPSGKLAHKYMTKSFSNIKLHVGVSPIDFHNWNTQIDVYIEDAWHENPILRSNINFWKKFVRPGGYIVGHDYHAEYYPHIFEEFNNLLNLGWGLISLDETLLILQKPIN